MNQVPEQPSLSPTRAVLRRLLANPAAVAGLVIVAVLVLFAVFAPLISPHKYDEIYYDYLDQPQPPGKILKIGADEEGGDVFARVWFGTDDAGRDMLVLLAMGARVSLQVGLYASLISLFIGVGWGATSGWFGGRVDQVMMRVVDTLYGIPLLLIVINLMVIFGPGLKNVFLALGFVYWLDMARIVRGQVLRLRSTDYVQAAQSIGVGRWRILVRHILPNTMGPIVVTLTLTVPHAIFTESFLSYIGLGVSAPMESWGTLAAVGTKPEYLMNSPHVVFFPAAAISLAMLAFNFVGDGLRDALDPRDLGKR